MHENLAEFLPVRARSADDSSVVKAPVEGVETIEVFVVDLGELPVGESDEFHGRIRLAGAARPAAPP